MPEEKNSFFWDSKCFESQFNRSTSKMQIESMHIYDFTGWVTGSPLASAFIYLENQHVFVLLFKQVPFFKPWLEQSVNYEFAVSQSRE